MRFSLGAFLLLTFVATGCSGPRPAPSLDRRLPERYPNHSVAEILGLLMAPDSIRAFSAKASLSLSTPQQSGRFSADVASRRGDSLFLSLSPGLGIEAARVLVTPDSFYVYDRIHKRLQYGALDRIAEVLPVPPDAEGVFLNLLGLDRPDPRVAWQLSADDGYYTLLAPGGTQRWVVDPAFWRPVRYQATAPDGTLLEERVFGEIDRFGALFLPRQVVFRQPEGETSAAIYYRTLTLNPRGLAFDLRVSDDAKRIPIE